MVKNFAGAYATRPAMKRKMVSPQNRQAGGIAKVHEI
jgi:hypothetical protein